MTVHAISIDTDALLTAVARLMVFATVSDNEEVTDAFAHSAEEFGTLFNLDIKRCEARAREMLDAGLRKRAAQNN